jgi:hypothetical protein
VPAKPWAVDPNASQDAQASAQGLAKLEDLVGRWLRGDVVVYRGTVHAHDNASALANTEVYGPRPDGVIADQPALAALDLHPTRGGDFSPVREDGPGQSATLVVHATTDKLLFTLGQSDAQTTTTLASFIEGDHTTATLATSCDGCAPSFWAKPATLAIDLETSTVVTVFQGYAGQDGHDVDVTAHTWATAALTRADACSLRWEDLVVLDGLTGPNEFSSDLGLSDFKLEGGDYVWHDGGAFSGPPYNGKCYTSTSYKIDLYIDAADLGRYGTRNFVLGTSQTMCPP